MVYDGNSRQWNNNPLQVRSEKTLQTLEIQHKKVEENGMSSNKNKRINLIIIQFPPERKRPSPPCPQPKTEQTD